MKRRYERPSVRSNCLHPSFFSAKYLHIDRHYETRNWTVTDYSPVNRDVRSSVLRYEGMYDFDETT